MKFLQAIFIVFVSGAFFVAKGQELTQTIRGSVIDKDSHVPIPGSNVVIEYAGHFLGASSDIDGNFKIENVPVGRHTVKITSLGYEDVLITNAQVGSGKELVLNIEMEESVIGLKEVVIHSEKDKLQPVNEMNIISARTFTVEETHRYAGSWNDPSRMALSYAGVNGGSDDKENEIVIRGNSPRGMLWMVEGMEVPSPNHFSDEGSSSGAVSILSSNMMASSDFLTGAFPAEYGNALSGVFDIRLRNGNNQRREFALETSVIGLDFAMEGPFVKGKKTSYLANYRYSTLALVPLLGVEIKGQLPVFQDLAFKVHAPTKAGTFTIFGIGGKSSLQYKEDGERDDGSKGLKYEEELGSDMMAGGISHNYIVSEKMYIKSTAAFTAQVIRHSEIRHTSATSYLLTDKERYLNYAGKAIVTINNKFSSRHHLKSGIIYSHLFFDLLKENFSQKRQTLDLDVDDDGHTDAIQAYSSWRFKIRDDWTLNAGIHLLYFLLNGHVSPEPRAALRWQIKPKHALTAGVGLHSKMEGLSVYLYKKSRKDGTVVQPNHDLDFTKAAHFVAGYDYRILTNLNLKVEAYYQYLFNVPISEDSSGIYSAINAKHGFTKNNLENKGTGENYGIELTLEKFFSKNYFFLFTASLYNSKFIPADGIKRDTRFNNHYIVNVLGGKEFTVGKRKQNIIGLSLRGTVAGGKRYTPINEELSLLQGTKVEDEAQIYAKQGPVYHRFDFAFYFTQNTRHTTMTWKIDVQNIANHQNVVDYDYDPERGVVAQRNGQILPVLSFKLEF